MMEMRVEINARTFTAMSNLLDSLARFECFGVGCSEHPKYENVTVINFAGKIKERQYNSKRSPQFGKAPGVTQAESHILPQGGDRYIIEITQTSFLKCIQQTNHLWKSKLAIS